MLILAFDTTMLACSVAVCRVGATLAQRRSLMAQGHAEALVPLIAATMDVAGVGFPDLERIAVTTGPGSFTGVRVGLAAARGFGLALRIPVVGVRTGAVLAADAAQAGTIVSLIDTKRGDFYAEAYTADGTALGDPVVLAPGAVNGWVGAAGWPAPVTLVGDGAAAAAAAGVEGVTAAERDVPDPAILATLAAAATPSAEGPLPVYVRAPDVSFPALARC